MPDNLNIYGQIYPDAAGIKAKDTNGNTLTFYRPLGTKSIIENGTGIDVVGYAAVDVAVPTGVDLPVFTLTYSEVSDDYSVACNKTFAECMVLLYDTAYGAILMDGYTTYILSCISDDNSRIWYALYEGDVILYDIIYYSNGSIEYVNPSSLSLTLNATSNGTYTPNDEGLLGVYTEVNINVPTGTARSSSDLTVSGATVTVPAGLYSSNASASVPSGTAGTPSAAKGTVSNNSITVTPSVTNVTGYIIGGTKIGTGVSVSASELVSGTYTVDSSGTKDITNYASISVSAGTAGTPSATKGTVSNHSISVTPSVTNTTGWITGSTKSGTAVTVSASELVSGSETKTSNGTYDVTNLASLLVAIPIVTYYTGSSAPSSSLGLNGDIYLLTS